MAKIHRDNHIIFTKKKHFVNNKNNITKKSLQINLQRQKVLTKKKNVNKYKEGKSYFLCYRLFN